MFMNLYYKTGFILTTFCFLWLSVWAPREIFEPDLVPWCWSRMLRNQTHFGDRDKLY